MSNVCKLFIMALQKGLHACNYNISIKCRWNGSKQKVTFGEAKFHQRYSGRQLENKHFITIPLPPPFIILRRGISRYIHICINCEQFYQALVDCNYLDYLEENDFTDTDGIYSGGNLVRYCCPPIKCFPFTIIFHCLSDNICIATFIDCITKSKK